jgi:uncharacterized protein (TIGR00369 family)
MNTNVNNNESSAQANSANAEIFARIQNSFSRQGMLQYLGVKIVRVEKGEVEFELPYSEKVTQQQAGFHGGAIGMLADISAGYAALTVTEPGLEVTTVEYKVNFLAAFKGGRLRAIGKVVRAGRRLIVATALVQHQSKEAQEQHQTQWLDCAIMQATIAPIPKTYQVE